MQDIIRDYTPDEKRRLLDRAIKHEPVIEELFETQAELEALEDEKVERKLLGYHFWCVECERDFIVHNPDQLMCPRCGTPMFSESNEPLEECWSHEQEVIHYSRLKNVLTTKEKQNAIGSC